LEFRFCSCSCDAFKLDPTFALRSHFALSLLGKVLEKVLVAIKSSCYASFACASERERFRSLSLSRSAEVSPGIVIVFLLFLLLLQLLQLGETATTLEFGVQGGPNSKLQVIEQVRNINLFKAYPRDKLKIGFKF